VKTPGFWRAPRGESSCAIAGTGQVLALSSSFLVVASVVGDARSDDEDESRDSRVVWPARRGRGSGRCPNSAKQETAKEASKDTAKEVAIGAEMRIAASCSVQVLLYSFNT
jgi:hypothetical protein